MRCLICKSNTMVRGTSTYFATLEHGYVIIENVPCQRCSQCGEVVYSATTLEKIDAILGDAKNITGNVEGATTDLQDLRDGEITIQATTPFLKTGELKFNH